VLRVSPPLTVRLLLIVCGYVKVLLLPTRAKAPGVRPSSNHGAILYYSRQYDRAIAQCRAVLDMDPNFPRARFFLFVAYVQEGRFVEALEEIGRDQGPDNVLWIWANKAYLYSRWGRSAEAEHALRKFEPLALELHSYRAPWTLIAYVNAGRKDQAIALLKQAYSEHSNVLTSLKVDAMYDPLRGDPRFQQLLRLMNFPE